MIVFWTCEVYGHYRDIRYGRFNTARKLLNSVNGKLIINEGDGEGMTSLHLAAQNGQTKVVQLLLSKGASLHRNHHGQTPLHLAAFNGYTQTMMLFLSIHSHLLDQVDKEGKTALILAIEENHINAIKYLLDMEAKLIPTFDGDTVWDFIFDNKNQDAAIVLITHPRWQTLMSAKSNRYQCIVLTLIEQMPEAMKVLLDQCHTVADCDPSSKDFYHMFNYFYLQASIKDMARIQSNGQSCMPLFALNTMVKFGRVQLLCHPVSIQYLRMKWNAYGVYIHMTNMIFYLIFLSLMTYFTCSQVSMQNKITTFNNEMENSSNTSATKIIIHNTQFSTFNKICIGFLLVFIAGNIIKEIVQLYQQGFKYIKDILNYVEWILYLTSACFISADWLPISEVFKWQCGSVALFLIWFNLLLHLQRFDILGIYVIMFMEILKTLLQVLLVFSILIIAFALAFYILMINEVSGAHSTPGMSLFRTGYMMLGDVDLINNYVKPYFDENPLTLPYKDLTFSFLFLFAVFMPILLMNLLIGLAVGDIESVQKHAQLKRIAKQVEIHTDLERRLPQSIIARVDKVQQYIYVNRCCSVRGKICDRVWEATGSAFNLNEDEYGTGSTNITRHLKQDYLYNELDKQKKRLKEVTSIMEKQYQLIRLIVQKMEIKSETDNLDEGGDVQPSQKSKSKWKKLQQVTSILKTKSKKK